MCSKPYVLVIGGANIDFVGLPSGPLVWHDKNPGVIKTSLGGVGRNIAENIARLGVETKLLSLVGDDSYGGHLIEQTANKGVDISLLQQLPGQRSSVYLSIMDSNDDMALAMSDMGIIGLLTPDVVARYEVEIQSAMFVVLDTNLPQETLAYLLQSYPNVCFFVDTVSVSKTQKISDLLTCIDTLKPNRLEAEFLTGVTISSLDDAHTACNTILSKGVNNVYISLGEWGIVYGNAAYGTRHQAPRGTNVVNAAGAGDAMMAAIVYARAHNMQVENTLRFANAAAALTLASESTIHENFSIARIEELMA